MPRLDKTGPSGQGPMTGRGLGSCGAGAGAGAGAGRGRGNRFGMGRGPGRAFGRNWFGSRADPKKNLVEYKKFLEEELEAIKKEESSTDANPKQQ